MPLDVGNFLEAITTANPDALAKERRDKAARAKTLRSALKVLDPENKELYETMGAEDLEGRFTALGVRRLQEEQNVKANLDYLRALQLAKSIEQSDALFRQGLQARQAWQKAMQALNAPGEGENPLAPPPLIAAQPDIRNRLLAALSATQSPEEALRVADAVRAVSQAEKDTSNQLFGPRAGVLDVAGWKVPWAQTSQAQVQILPELAESASGKLNPRYGRPEDLGQRERLAAAQKTMDRILRISPNLRTPEDERDLEIARSILREAFGDARTATQPVLGGPSGATLWDEFVKSRKK